MVVVAWVLFVAFGVIGSLYTLKWMFSSLKPLEVPVWLLAIVVTAFSAGVIWGRLFQ